MLSKKYFDHHKTTQNYCFGCKKNTDNIGLKKVIMANKVIRQASKCANSVAERFLKQKFNKKTAWDNTNPKVFIH